MSEQEIFEHLEKMCVLDELCYEVDCLDEKDLQVIRELIKLYNKQKEVNKSLVYNFEKLVDKYEKLSNEYFKLLGELNNEQRY